MGVMGREVPARGGPGVLRGVMRTRRNRRNLGPQDEDMGVGQNHRKTIGKWWFNGISWDIHGIFMGYSWDIV